MKPTRNRVYCRECGRSKMLFETEKKAQLFMRFNNEEISNENGYAPVRAYYCMACGGWHLTHHKTDFTGPSKTEQALEQMHNDVDGYREMRKQCKSQRKSVQSENEKYAREQMDEAQKLIDAGDNNKAKEILNAILTMSRTKYFKPKTLKNVRAMLNNLSK